MGDGPILAEGESEPVGARRQVKLHKAVRPVGVDAHLPRVLQKVEAVAAALPAEEVDGEEVITALVLGHRVPRQEQPYRRWAATADVNGEGILRVAAHVDAVVARVALAALWPLAVVGRVVCKELRVPVEIDPLS